MIFVSHETPEHEIEGFFYRFNSENEVKRFFYENRDALFHKNRKGTEFSAQYICSKIIGLYKDCDFRFEYSSNLRAYIVFLMQKRERNKSKLKMVPISQNEVL